jgi:multiple sugar transport system substrate-binding protein
MIRKKLAAAAAMTLLAGPVLTGCGGSSSSAGGGSSSAATSGGAAATSAAPAATSAGSAASSSAPAATGSAPAATGSASAATSGGPAASSSNPPVTVKSLSVLDYFTDEPRHSQAEALLTKCGASLGVGKINQTSVPGTSLIQTVLQEASSKTLPNILMLDNPDIQQIAATGALAPLSDLGISAAGFIPGAVSAATYQGKLYGLQPAANTIAIFYNKDVLAKAGVTPPTTWADLESDAKKLTVPPQYGFAFNATGDYEGSWTFLPPMWTNGGDETALKSPAVAQALQLYKDLVTAGSASKSVVTWSQADVNDQFVAGKAAMMLNGPWQIPALQKAKINFGVSTFPVNKAGQTSQAPLGGEAWTVPLNKDTATEQKAADVVKCMNSDANQLTWSEEQGLVPTKTALDAQFEKADPVMAGFVAAVAHARARTGKLGANWPAAAKTIYTGEQLVLTGQASAADAMAKAGAQ